jgi:death-on-curing protein
MPPIFLTLAEALEIQSDQILRYGGRGGLRDIGLLNSALAMPSASFGGEYLHPSPHEMAAAYLFHIVRNHPFVDGNKRSGAVAALVFLAMNNVACTASPVALERLVTGVADGTTRKPAVAAFLEKYCG